MEGLTVGRIVHFVAPETRRLLRTDLPHGPLEWKEEPNPEAGQHLAAIVVGIVDAEAGQVNLQVFENRPAMEFRDGVAYSLTGEPGAWHWPERA